VEKTPFVALLSPQRCHRYRVIRRTRPNPPQGAGRSQGRGYRRHVFEEGTCRPYWVTMSAARSNGNLELMACRRTDAARAQVQFGDCARSPAHWVTHSRANNVFLRGCCILVFRNGACIANFRPHPSLPRESRSSALPQRLLLDSPRWHWIGCSSDVRIGLRVSLAIWRFATEHDSSFQENSRSRHDDFFMTSCRWNFVKAPRTLLSLKPSAGRRPRTVRAWWKRVYAL